MTVLPEDLRAWLADSADGIDLGEVPAEEILPRLAAAGLTRVGIKSELGGTGGDVVDAVQSVSALAQESLAVAFVLWGHRCYAEFLVQTDNVALRDRQLTRILAGEIAGASALSNVMKYLAGLEPLQVLARETEAALEISGKLPWVTNLRPQGFFVAAAADRENGEPTMIVALSHDDPGVERSEDLELLGMRSTNTAAVSLSGVPLQSDRIIAENAEEWLPGVRPTFIALQCGMAIGLAERALEEASLFGGGGRDVLTADIAALRDKLAEAVEALYVGLRNNNFVSHPASLFKLRIRIAQIVSHAVTLELQAGGGRCYLSGPGRNFARRWREAAFVPLITPSVVQLRTVLATTRVTI